MTAARSALFNLFFFASTAVLSLWGVGLRLFAPHRALGLVMFWARLELGAAQVICGIRFEVTGRENIGAGPALIASQHQSAFDTMVWFLLLPRCCYVAKRELTRIPLFGPLIRPAGLIVVDRRRGAAAVRELLRDARRALAEARQIVIFPEGTRAAPGRVLPIQPGIAALAAATRLPVVPVLTDSGRFWGRRAFRKRRGTIRITILPPLPMAFSRGALITELARLFHDVGPVDRSVDMASRHLSSGSREEPQTIG